MATATKKAPAKKASAKATETTSAEDRRAARKELADKIVEARNEGQKWEEIAATFGTSTGRAMLLHMEATVKPKDRIKGTEEEVAAKIAEARDEERQSWGQIMARTGLAETKCRNLYEQATGNSTRGNRIGKGGRYPDGMTPPARPSAAKEKAVKKAAAKKAAPAKKAPAGGGLSAAAKKIAGLDGVKEIADALVGKVISYKAGGKQARTKVADLLDVTGEGADMEITVQDNDEQEITISVSSIIKVATR